MVQGSYSGTPGGVLVALGTPNLKPRLTTSVLGCGRLYRDNQYDDRWVWAPRFLKILGVRCIRSMGNAPWALTTKGSFESF